MLGGGGGGWKGTGCWRAQLQQNSKVTSGPWHHATGAMLVYVDIYCYIDLFMILFISIFGAGPVSCWHICALQVVCQHTRTHASHHAPPCHLCLSMTSCVNHAPGPCSLLTYHCNFDRCDFVLLQVGSLSMKIKASCEASECLDPAGPKLVGSAVERASGPPIGPPLVAALPLFALVASGIVCLAALFR